MFCIAGLQSGSCPASWTRRRAICGQRCRTVLLASSKGPGSSSVTVRNASSLRARLLQTWRKVADNGLASDGPVALTDTSFIAGKLANPITSLLLVSLIWGTYTPAMRFLFDMDDAPSPQLVTALRTVMSSTFLLLISALSQPGARLPVSSSSVKADVSKSQFLARTPADTLRTSLPKLQALSSIGADYLRSLRQQPLQPQNVLRGLLNTTFSNVILAGMELGFWNFLGTSLQAQGLQLTSATKGAFLGQITTVVTPCLAYVGGEYVNSTTWFSCILGLIGGGLISFDGLGNVLRHSDLLPNSGHGELFVLLGCTFYSVTTVRLGKYAPMFSSVQLAAVKVSTLAVISTVWLFADSSAPTSVLRLMNVHDPLYWTVLLYTAVGPGAAAALLQTHAQSKVPPAQAQVIYSLTPVWSALLGVTLLHGENMGAGGWMGASVILFASVLAARAPSTPNKASLSDTGTDKGTDDLKMHGVVDVDGRIDGRIDGSQMQQVDTDTVSGSSEHKRK